MPSPKRLGKLVLVVICAAHLCAAATVSFQPERSYTVGTNPKAVATGDFNHDGKRDLAVVNYGDPTTGDNGSVSILFGKGDGTFQSAKNVAIGKNCTSLVAGDFNGDGNDDLALLRPGDPTVSGDDGDVTIFLGNGDGTFHQGQVLTPGTTSGNRQAMIAIDLNSDQRLDLVVANFGDFSVLLGNGDGTFQAPVAYPVNSAVINMSLAVVDLSGNGEKDLLVFRLFAVDAWLGDGDGTFRPGSGVFGRGITAGDFNGDGKADLITVPFRVCLFHCGPGPSSPPPADLWLGNGDGTFQPAIGIGRPVEAAADFDGDGKLDLVSTSSNNGSAQILVSLGNGDGTFQQPIAFPMNSNEGLSQVLDVNGDSARDLVLLGQNDIGLLINVGTDFSISASALSPTTLSASQSATSTVSLTLLSAFDNPVALACSVQPAQTGAPTCLLSSNSVTFDASGKASAMLTINAGSSAAFNSPQTFSKGSLLWFPMTGLAFLGTGVGFSRRRKPLAFLVSAVLCAGLITQLACGGGSSGPKSTAYTVTVTGSSGATQHSTTVQLTVQ